MTNSKLPYFFVTLPAVVLLTWEAHADLILGSGSGWLGRQEDFIAFSVPVTIATIVGLSWVSMLRWGARRAHTWPMSKRVLAWLPAMLLAFVGASLPLYFGNQAAPQLGLAECFHGQRIWPSLLASVVMAYLLLPYGACLALALFFPRTPSPSGRLKGWARAISWGWLLLVCAITLGGIWISFWSAFR